jgi:hypothetical protein
MILYSLIITSIISLIIYLLILSKSKQNAYKIQVDEKKTQISQTSIESPRILHPYIIFNSLKIDSSFTIPKGTYITENLFILSGKIEIIYENIKIGLLKEDEMTFNCFDLCGLNFKILKRAATDVLVYKVPSSTVGYLNLKFLEKTCFEPALKFCMCHSQIAKLETIKTSNFEDYLIKNFNLKDHKPETCNYISSEDLEERK